MGTLVLMLAPIGKQRYILGFNALRHFMLHLMKMLEHIVAFVKIPQNMFLSPNKTSRHQTIHHFKSLVLPYTLVQQKSYSSMSSPSVVINHTLIFVSDFHLLLCALSWDRWHSDVEAGLHHHARFA